MSRRSALILCSAAAVAAAFVVQNKNLAPEKQSRISEQGVALIVDVEGCTRNAYKCPADVWTNGVGNTHNVDKNKILTIDEVAADLRENIKNAEQCILDHFNGAAMKQNQFDAMTSLAFNVGCGNIKTYYSKQQGKRIPTTIWRAAQQQDWRTMCGRIEDFNKAGGRVLKGLQRRREREKALCLA